MTRAFLGAMLLAAAPLAAQDSELVGTWRVSIPVTVHVEAGVVTPVMGTGTLTISPSGDSLVAKLETDSIANEPMRPVVQMGGKAKDNAVSFVSRSKATLSVNGGATQREMVGISTWAVTAVGDSLTGTVERRIEGMSMGSVGPQPVKGSRKRA